MVGYPYPHCLLSFTLIVQEVLRDPLSAEAQRLIEESIHQENIEQALTHALEYQPEDFARVFML